MGWYRHRAARLIATVALVVAVVSTASGAMAQTDAPRGPVVETEQTAVGSVEIVRDDDTSDTVQRIRRNLVTLAVVTGLGLAVYVWHTSPRHRLAVASRRVAEDDDG